MSYRINLGQWNSVFAVPSAVADKHLKLATELQLKTLIYILRHAGGELSAEGIASFLGADPDEVANAVDFWIERGLLSSDSGVLSPSEGSADAPVEAAAAPSNDAEDKKSHTAVSRAVRPDPAFAAKLIRDDANLSGLMEEAQSVMKKPLSPGDTATLVMLYDTFGLPCEVIAMLLNYVESTGNPNMRAVERYGISWSDNGVYSVEAAEREIERMTASKEAWGRVASVIGVRSAGRPTSAQLTNADRWLNTWGFNDDMILEAYERCVNKKGEFNMSYINGILKKWYEKRVFSLDALKEADAAASRGRSRTKARSDTKKDSVFSVEGGSFDISAFDSKSLFDD